MLAPTPAFTAYWELGYTSLIPIIPPSAEINPNSSLYKRVGTHQDARGKVPGIRKADGTWVSWDWVPHVTDEHDIQRWAAMQAGVGIRTGDGLYAIDADTTDLECAKIVRAIVEDVLGADCPVRIGRNPKALYPFRLAGGDVPYARVEFGEPDERGNLERVEILGARRQFVAEGIHPKTKQPYSWPRPLVPFDDLPTLDHADLSDLLNRIRDALPKAKPIITEGAGADVNQDALEGDPAAVRKAVEAIPNTSAHFPARENYLAIGYAIKAAIPDEHEAFDVFLDWCERWAEGTNDRDIVEADWRRMRPPYRRGAQYLYDLADQIGSGFSSAEAHFTPVEEKPLDPFDTQMQAERVKEEQEAPSTFPLLSLDEIISRPPPTFLIDNHIPETSVGFLYADPGAGKSFVAMDMGLSIAHAFPDWHGEAIQAPENAAVLYIAAEGSFDLRNRFRAWLKARGISKLSKSFFIIEQTIRFTSPEDIGRLRATIRSLNAPLAFVVVDTVSRALPGVDENAQHDMTIFAEACAIVQREHRCSVLGVHHTNKQGGMRGSSVLMGAGDYVLKLTREKGARLGTLLMEKLKAGADGWSYQIAFDPIELEEDDKGRMQSSLVPNRPTPAQAAVIKAESAGPGVGTVERAAQDRAILEAVRAAWESGEPWAMARNARLERRALRRLGIDFGLVGDAGEARLGELMGMGWIVEKGFGKGERAKGLSVGVGAFEALSALQAAREGVADEAVSAHFEPVTNCPDEGGDAFG